EADAETTYTALTARPCLLVLDNAEDVPAGDSRRAGYLTLMSRARGAGACVLLTSRVEWKELKPRKVIDLYPLPDDPALRAAQAILGLVDAGTGGRGAGKTAVAGLAGIQRPPGRGIRRSLETELAGTGRFLVGFGAAQGRRACAR
ncbi:MAG TPA: hypothetical protein PLE50_01560, partial [Rhabdaerophilum sp.]|nr:hypothetical protein [Rhabdaerophilum sp.]